VARRVSPIDTIRAQIDELFTSGKELGTVLEEVGRLTVRLMMQSAIEAEVNAFLGRERYERRSDEDRPGYRNGHQPPTTVKTTMGTVELTRPKLRDTDERFCSREHPDEMLCRPFRGQPPRVWQPARDCGRATLKRGCSVAPTITARETPVADAPATSALQIANRKLESLLALNIVDSPRSGTGYLRELQANQKKGNGGLL